MGLARTSHHRRQQQSRGPEEAGAVMTEPPELPWLWMPKKGKTKESQAEERKRVRFDFISYIHDQIEKEHNAVDPEYEKEIEREFIRSQAKPAASKPDELGEALAAAE